MSSNWDTREAIRLAKSDVSYRLEPGQYSADEVRARFENVGMPMSINDAFVNWEAVADSLE